MAENTILINSTDMAGLIRSLDVIQARFGNRKLKQIARKGAKPLRAEMRNIAPQYKNNSNKKKKKYYYYSGERVKYKSGTLKRSVGTFAGKKGYFVAPRIGKLNRRVSGKANLDGWYAHLAISPHATRGGGKTKNHQNPDFVEKARVAKAGEVLNIMLKEAEKLIKW
jgi:hypothetical protein